MNMEYRKLGGSGLKVSVVSLGTWAIGGFMWGGTDDKAAIAAIRKSIDLGVTTIDTAPVYGFGHSEELVGRAIEGRRNSVVILTKFGLRWQDEKGTPHFETKDTEGKKVVIYDCARRDAVIEECEQSLKRLRTDYIDLYQQHWPDPETPVEETFEAVSKLLKDGKIRAAGVSNFSPAQMDAARKVVPIASCQPPYSMVNRAVEKDVLPYCKKNNIGVLVYSPLQRGLLTGKISKDYVFPSTDHRAEDRFFKPENRARVLAFLEKIKPIAEEHGATLAQVVVSWTIHRPGVTAALVGARNPIQAEENAGAAKVKLTAKETERINGLLEDLRLEL
jgi:aryl-alcohol dehydrogenase-like predicted oxidoreductase